MVLKAVPIADQESDMSTDEAVSTGCSCGCGTMTQVTSAGEACGCGCECCGESAKTAEQEIAELTTLKHSIDRRLSELAG